VHDEGVQAVPGFEALLAADRENGDVDVDEEVVLDGSFAGHKSSALRSRV